MPLLRVLVLEDQPSDAELMVHELLRAGFDPVWERAESEEEYLAHLEMDPAPEVILADYTLPQSDAMRALRLLKERGLDIPFIVVTATVSEEVAVECMKQGAADYLLKDRLARLGQAVRRALEEKQTREARRRMEEALVESEARFRRLAENAQDLIYRYELLPARGFSYVSPAATRIVGYTPEEHYDDPDLGFKLIHPEDRHRLEGLAAGKQLSVPVVLRWLHKEGRTVWVERRNVPVYDEAGNLVAIEGIARDITMQRLSEEALREGEERYRSTLEAIDDAINVKDTEGRYLAVNAEFLRRYGRSAPELLGRLPSEIHGLEIGCRVAEEDARVLESGLPVEAEREHPEMRPPRVFHVRKVPLRDRSGAIVGLVTVSRDITERKRMEERLLRAQRLEMAGRIAGQVAHDFGNLLLPLVAYPDLIETQLPPGHPALRYCHEMRAAATQMEAINDDLMTLGRRGLIDSAPIDVGSLVEQAMAMATPRPETLRIHQEVAPGLLPARGSATQLLRVLSNLVSNARDAMRDRGVLRISAESVYLDRPFGRYNRVEVGEYVRLSVSDTGYGIPPEIKDRIFDAFFTTKRTPGRRGSGLGLAIVDAIVGDHQGYIDLESEVGVGTTFSIYLPVCRQAAVPQTEHRSRGGTESLLVVDDDRLQRELLGQLLETLGYRVGAVESGERAIEYVKEHAPDLLVLDMVMPGEIDGAETYRRVVQFHPAQRAVILSGIAETEKVREAQSLGCGTFLQKPVTMEMLARAIRMELDSSAQHPR